MSIVESSVSRMFFHNVDFLSFKPAWSCLAVLIYLLLSYIAVAVFSKDGMLRLTCTVILDVGLS